MTSINTGRGFPLIFKTNEKVLFDDNTILTTMEGSIGYEAATDKFYGVTVATDVESTRKRQLTQSIATASNAGQTKIGTNLEINSGSGVLSSIAVSGSRLFDLIVTVSTISGAGDYRTIEAAIEGAIGTAAGNYTNGSMTQASQLNSAPSETYQFIILLAPGLYEISSQITLPDYVSIIGTQKNTCIIRYTQSSDATLANSAAILTGTNSVLADFILELDPNNKTNICGIYNNSNNVVVDNINIRDITTTESSTNMYGFYGTGEMIQTFKDIDLLFSMGSSTTYGFYFNGTINRINNCKTVINSESYSTANTVNYGIYMTSCYLTTSINSNKIVKYNDFYENTITIKGADLNYGIYCDNSSINSLHNKIECNGETSGRAGNNFGIGIKSSSAPITSSSSVIKFNRIVGGKDTIESTNTGTVNFISLGFVPGHIVKVSGADNDHNNNFFTIATVTSSLLTLTSNDTLIHEQSPSGNITISLALDIKLFYNKISGSKHCVYGNGSNGNYSIYERFCSLEGGDMNLNGDRLKGGSGTDGGINTITVAKRGGDFTNLSNAISNIVSSSSLNKYLINIEPGEYIELGNQNSMLVMTSNTTIIGSGIENTILKFDNSDSVNVNAGGIKFTHDNVIMNLTIENNNNETDLSYVLGGLGTTDDKISNVSIKNVKLNYTGTGVSGSKYGMIVSDIDDLNINNIIVNMNGLAINYGIVIDNCTGIINGTDILVQGNSTNNYGLSVTNSNIDIHYANVLVTATSSSTPNYGLKLDDGSGTTLKYINLHNSSIRTEHSGSLSGTNEFSIYRVGNSNVGYRLIANNSRLDGDIKDVHTSSDTKMKFNNCYRINSNNVYQPIGNKGHLDETSNGSIVIGDNAGGELGLSSGFQNTIIGTNTGNAITSGKYNTFLGSNVGNRVTTSNLNVAIGYNSGNILGNGCVSIGNLVHSASETTGHDDNVLIGKQAGYSLTSENSQNVIIGNLAGANLTVSSGGQTNMKNVIIGSNCAYSIDDGVNNIMIGDSILYNNASGNDPSSSVLIGNSVSYNSSNSTNNINLGHEAGYENLGTENVFIGRESGRETVDANRNVLIGLKSGYQGSQGDQNIYVGNEAGYSTSNSTGSFNIGFGNRTGYNMANSGNKNIMFGGKTTNGNTGTQDSAGYAISSGSNNVIFGIVAGKAITTGTDNILVGEGAGKYINTGVDNVIIGSNAGSTLTTNNYNVFIGGNSGTISVNSDNLFIGHESGRLNISTRNVAIGYRSGYLVNANDNIFFGQHAGGNINGTRITGINNNFVGFRAGYNASTGNNNIILGSGSNSEGTGRSISSGSNNVCFGYLSGASLTTQNDNINLGARSGQNATGNNNLFIGQHAGKNTTTDNNILIGHKAGMEQTIGIQNIYVGFETNKNVRDGRHNINIGYKSGYSNNLIRANIEDEKNRFNICLGREVGYNLNSNSNILMGYQTGYYLDSVEDGYNIFMGKESGKNVRTGNRNIYLGNRSGKFNSGGDKNICLGSSAGVGDQLYAVNKNILIGASAGKLNRGSKHIYIGNYTDDTKGVGYVSSTSSLKNIYIGNSSGIENTNGKFNIAIGSSGLSEITTGDYNIATGDSSLSSLTTGNKNIGISINVGSTLTTGQNNIIFGSLAGENIGTSVNNSILFGRSAGRNTTVDNLIAIGTSAGYATTSGINNIFIGANAGSDCTISGNNIFFGNNSGFNVVSGTGENIYMGTSAGENSSLTTYNSIALGYNAFKDGVADQNICLGSNAGMNMSGADNIVIGVDAGMTSSSGSGSIIIGKNAARLGDGFNESIIMGTDSGRKLTSSYNIAIGTESQFNATNAYNNIAFGRNSLRRTGFNDALNTGAEMNFRNVCFGLNTMRYTKYPFQNIAIGTNAAEYYDNRTLDAAKNGNCLFMGTNAGRYNNGDNATCIGKDAGRALKYGNKSFTSNKISIYSDSSNGYASGAYIFLSDTSGSDFTDPGFAVDSHMAIRGFDNDGNNFSFDLDYRKLVSVSANIIVFTGGSRLDPAIINESEGNTITVYNPSATEGVSVGYESGFIDMGGESIGYRAGYTGGGTFYGINAGKNSLESSTNTCIGNHTILGYSDISYGVAIGSYAGSIMTEEQEGSGLTCTKYTNNTVFIGKYAGANLFDKANRSHYGALYTYNVAIGNYSSAGPAPTTGLTLEAPYCVSLGNYSGYVTTARLNCGIGAGSNYHLTENAPRNLAIGYYANCNNPEGSNNIILSTSNVGLVSNVSVAVDDRFYVTRNSDLEADSIKPLIMGYLANTFVVINNNSVGSTGETSTKLYINGAAESYGFLPFTGVHEVDKDDEYVKEGLILSSVGDIRIINKLNTVVEVKVSVIVNDKKVYGIYAGCHKNKLTTGKIEFKYRAASVGEGTMLVIDHGGDIENGDYICSSGKGGYGMKQDDDILHSYTVAKATEDVIWDNIDDYIDIDGNKYKWFSVGCTYHCG